MTNYIFNCSWTSGKKALRLFAAQYWCCSCLWMSFSSESTVSSTTLRYCYWLTDFALRQPSVSNGMTVLFTLLVWNIIQTILLQLKVIACDSAKAWHTSCPSKSPSRGRLRPLCEPLVEMTPIFFPWLCLVDQILFRIIFPLFSITRALHHRKFYDE